MKKSTTFKGAPKPFGASGHFNEPRRHSLQAKGIKTGNLSRPLLPPSIDRDKDGFPNVIDCAPLDPTKQDTKTENRIAGMLKENTGASMLDSGSAYGRNWEKNQERTFKKEPEMTIDVYDDEVLLSISTFHYLNSFMEVTDESEKLNKQFYKFANEPEHKDESWLSNMENFMEHEFGSNEAVGDIYSDKDGMVMTVNTYNGESLIDQILQYTMFKKGGKTFVLMQVHGGCDARGGYTAPQVFEVAEDGVDYFLMANTNANASDGDNSWNTDDSYNWYGDGGKAKDGDPQPDQWRFDKEKGKVFSKINGKEVTFSGSLQY